MYNEILTDSGNKITVRRLRLFELDVEVPRPRPQPYTVTIEAYGGQFQQVFNLTVPREEPTVRLEECQENTFEWYDWREYLRYKQGILYYKKVLESLMEYHEQVAQYIVAHCIDESAVELIITEEDWNRIYKAALCPEVELEDLKTVTEQVFMASYDGMPLFDAFETEIEGGLGSFLSIRSWEVKLRKELQLTEEEYTKLGIMDRAIMIMAERIPDMMGQIDLERQRREYRHGSPQGTSDNSKEEPASSEGNP